MGINLTIWIENKEEIIIIKEMEITIDIGDNKNEYV